MARPSWAKAPRPCRSWPTTWRASVAKRRLAKRRSSEFRSADIFCSSSGGVTANRLRHWYWPTLAPAPRRPRAKRRACRPQTGCCARELPDSSRRCCPGCSLQATHTNRPDIVDAARKMMQAMSPDDVAGVQRGMAERPDSVATLATINVPTLIIAGEEDSVPRSEFELMRQRIAGSELRVISRTGHYAALEKPEAFGGLLRDAVAGSISSHCQWEVSRCLPPCPSAKRGTVFSGN